MNNPPRNQLKEQYLFQLDRVNKKFSFDLIEEIKVAFREVEYPESKFFSGDEKHNVECSECYDCHIYFVGKTWEECLDEQSNLKLYGCQSFFKSDVWHYFLPAYLIQSISCKRFSLSEFSEFIDDELPEVEEWQRGKIELLSYKQCHVILEYLKMTVEVWKNIESGFEDDGKTIEFWENNELNARRREENL